jgi:glycerol-3-phosphate acyltransferase PlsY
VATFLGDMLKGLIPVLISQALTLGLEITGAIGLLAFLGHCYPIFLKFQGGKGVATGFGACLGIAPVSSLITLGIWLGTFALTRTSSLSALIAALTLPLLILIFNHHQLLYFFILPLIALLIFNHRENIKRLLKGTEAKF